MALDAAVRPTEHSRLREINKWIVTLAVLSGAVMGAIDTSVVNVALVHIMGSFGVNTQQVAWVTTAYLISVVLVMPLTAWVGTVIGRKRAFLAAVLIFTGASALCGLSRTLAQLVAFRVVQGIGAGALQPMAQAIMRETFPPEEQGQAMGFYGMVIMLGPVIGPILGGWLTDTYSWPWIFFINLPVGMLALWMVSQFVVDPPYMRAQGVRRIDAPGIGLLAVGLVALQILLQQGEPDGWFQSPLIVALVIVSALALAAFVVWELRTAAPAVSLRVFRNLSFAAGALIAALSAVVGFGNLILLPLFLQQMLGYDATQAGLALMPRGLVMLLMLPLTGALYNRLGAFVMLLTGLALTAGSGFLMSRFTLDTGPLHILIPQLVQGGGFAFVWVALSTSALATIPRPQMQGAAGLFSLVWSLGGSVGTAVVVTLLDHKITTASANLVRYATMYNPTFMQWWKTYEAAFLARGSDLATAHRQALAVLGRLIGQQSAVVAFDYVFALTGVLAALCLPLILLLRRRAAEAVSAPVE